MIWAYGGRGSFVLSTVLNWSSLNIQFGGFALAGNEGAIIDDSLCLYHNGFTSLKLLNAMIK